MNFLLMKEQLYRSTQSGFLQYIRYHSLYIRGLKGEALNFLYQICSKQREHNYSFYQELHRRQKEARMKLEFQ